MDPAAPIIKQMTYHIERKMQQLSNSLDKRYGTVLQKIDGKRFDLFQNCLKEKPDIAECYQKSDKLHINVQFWKANKQFQDCIQTVTNDCLDEKIKKDSNFVQKRVNTCTLKYESIVVADLQKQIKRINKFL